MSLVHNPLAHKQVAKRRLLRAAALAATVILLLVVLVAPSAQSLVFAKELRVWTTQSMGSNLDHLKLSKEEGFEHYVVQVRPADGAVQVAWAFVEVRNLQGDLMCRGFTTYQYGTLSMVRQCPDLRLEHRYEVTWFTDQPGSKLTLVGY